VPQPPSERALALAGDVLAKIAAYDPRFPRPNEAMLRAWAEHITIRNPDPDDMMASVTKFYETPRDLYPKPADITTLARDMRRDRLDRGYPLPPPDKSADPVELDPPDARRMTLQEWEELHGVEFPRVAFGKSIPAEANPLKVVCPYCKALRGSPCVVPGTGQVLTKIRAHPSRMELVS